MRNSSKAVRVKTEDERDVRYNFKYRDINRGLNTRRGRTLRGTPGFCPGLFSFMVKASTKVKFWKNVTIGNRKSLTLDALNLGCLWMFTSMK